MADSDDLPPPPPVRKKVVRRLEEFEPDEIEVLKSIELSESGETEEEFHEHADMTMWSDFLVWYYYDDYLEKWLENDSPQEYTPYGYLPTYDGAEWALSILQEEVSYTNLIDDEILECVIPSVPRIELSDEWEKDEEIFQEGDSIIEWYGRNEMHEQDFYEQQQEEEREFHIGEDMIDQMIQRKCKQLKYEYIDVQPTNVWNVLRNPWAYKKNYFTEMKEKAHRFKWSEPEEYFDTCIEENIEMLDYKYHGKYCHTINDKLDLTNCNKKYIFLDYNQNCTYFRCERTDGDSYISRSSVGMSSYQKIKVHWISQLLQTSIIRYLVWYYKIKKTSKVQKEYEDKSRQTSIYEYMVPIQRNSYNQYNRLWCKGLDIFSQKDYLTNEQEEIEALKDIEIGDDGDVDDGDGWRFDEMCYWHFNTDNLWNGHDLDCPREDMHDYRNDLFFRMRIYDDAYEEDYAIKNQINQYKNIVDDFIEVSHQPYEKFELGVFCWKRLNDCCLGFSQIAWIEYEKLIKEFTQFKCSQIKDELLAAVYHPDRMMRLIARGYKDDIVKCYGS